MSKKMTLDQLIGNLINVRDNGISISLAEIQYIYAIVLKAMAKHTVYDTLQMRADIAKVFCEKFGISTSDIKATPLYYWEKNGFAENAERSWGNADSSMSESELKRKYKVKITSRDEALYNYEVGNFKISDAPPRDNSNFTTSPIQYVSDLIKYGFFKEVDGFEKALNTLIDKIIKEILR